MVVYITTNLIMGYNKSNIHKCCTGVYPSAYGFVWKFEHRI